MRGIKELNEKVDEILNDPKNYDKTIRIWRQRAKTGKLSLQKKIEIIEKFGANEVLLKFVPRKSDFYFAGNIDEVNKIKLPLEDDNN